MKFQTLHELFEAGITNLRNRSLGALYQSTHGGASETTLRRNQAALSLQALRQRVLCDVRERSIAGRFLGHDTPTPIIIAPWGSQRVVHDSGELGSAKGAGGNWMALSSATNSDPARVIEASAGPRLFQLYLFAGGAWLDELIERVIDLGYAGIVLTVGVASPSRRDRSLELPTPATLDFAHPLLDAAFNDPTFDPSFSLLAATDWAQVAAIQAKIAGRVPFGLKGIMTGQDAARAKQAGVDFIWVSNHGGRQLDYARAAIDVLPEVVRAVKPGGAATPSRAWPGFASGWRHDRTARPQIVVDSGFRRGTDVLQALALGADMVALGKTFTMALAAGGEQGVATAFELLAAELDSSLALMGHTDVYALAPEDVERVAYAVSRESCDREILELNP